MAEDKGDQQLELESRIEATVAKALENQLLAIVAQLGKESTEQKKAAGTRASGGGE